MESSSQADSKYGMLFVLAVLFCAAIMINLADSPSLWWDEGWTLSVARNWVESGHYGRISLGRNTPPGFEAAFPTTASIAFAFQYFGVGVAQARFTMASASSTEAIMEKPFSRLDIERFSQLFVVCQRQYFC